MMTIREYAFEALDELAEDFPAWKSDPTPLVVKLLFLYEGALRAVDPAELYQIVVDWQADRAAKPTGAYGSSE